MSHQDIYFSDNRSENILDLNIQNSCLVYALYNDKKAIFVINNTEVIHVSSFFSQITRKYSCQYQELKIKIVGRSNENEKIKKCAADFGITVLKTVIRNNHFQAILNWRSGVLQISKEIENYSGNHENLIELKSKTKVLIVDDSKTIRQILYTILSSDPTIEVVASVENPLDVENMIIQHNPDVMTLDIHMPEIDGVTLLKQLLPKYKIPTIMISSISKEEGPQVLQALEIGAIDYIQKPSMHEMKEVAPLIVERVKSAASAKIHLHSTIKQQKLVDHDIDNSKLLLIGSSTGGTEALRVILEQLPENIPPILIVQHIPPVFSAALANRLNGLCSFEVREAKDGDMVTPGLALIAPGGKQMGVKSIDSKLYVTITDDLAVNRHKPSVDYLFNSVQKVRNEKIVACILTGMGNDGAQGVLNLKNNGAKTIAQDKDTCVVFGMPRAAIDLGAVDYIVPLGDIAKKILKLSHSEKVDRIKKSS